MMNLVKAEEQQGREVSVCERERFVCDGGMDAGPGML